MRTHNTLWALAVLALAACGDDSMMVTDGGPGTDAPRADAPGVDAPISPTACTDYCTQVMATCTAGNQQYTDMADCMDYCTNAGWPAGTDGETSGNTLACRLYHVGVAATMMPDMHCPHAGPSGADTCGSVDFRTDAVTVFTRVDRMGMPAVATALISSAMKNTYNDSNPTDDAALMFAADLLGSLGALHAALDDDLGTLMLEPCSATMPAGVPECAAQEIATGGPTVLSLVVPDTLQIDPAMPSGFPNGRALPDPVIDVTLAIILLQMGGNCPSAAAPCTPGTLAAVPLNPAANDVAFGAMFPYLAAAHAP